MCPEGKPLLFVSFKVSSVLVAVQKNLSITVFSLNLCFVFFLLFLYEIFHLNFSLVEYSRFWNDIIEFSRVWTKVLLSAPIAFDHGVSQSIYSVFNKKAIFQQSPIVYLRAEKNVIEREGMSRAHIRDAAATCDILSYLEERVSKYERAFILD